MPVFVKCFAATALFFFVNSSALALDRVELQTALEEVLDSDATARRTTVALKVVDLASGEVLYDRFGDRLFTPASNLKIYTSACALDLFGPEHRFPTRISASVDKASGTIHGNLRIIGGGNAMLTSNELRGLADRVVDEWQLRKLNGKVIVDNLRYDDTRLGPGWMWDDQSYYYNMQVTPLMVDFNVVAVPGKFDKDGDPVRQAVQDPQAWVASRFREMLRDQDVSIQDTQTESSSGAMRKLEFAGTKLAETLRHFNHKSENAVGEVLLHEIAIAKEYERPSWADGAQEITKWLHETAGLEPGSFKLVDGSGLSRYNLISADSSVKLLAFMRQHKHAQTFFDALPAYEVETSPGTKQELVHAKPGGMSGVSTISGYAQTLDGRQLAFSLLANGFIGKSEPVQKLRGKVWSVLVRYSGDESE